MARSVYCKPCGDKTIATYDRHRERYRAMFGTLIDSKEQRLCDSCGCKLETDDAVLTFTTHPAGPEVVVEWEEQFIDMRHVVKIEDKPTQEKGL